jgi:hypothetical protein
VFEEEMAAVRDVGGDVAPFPFGGERPHFWSDDGEEAAPAAVPGFMAPMEDEPPLPVLRALPGPPAEGEHPLGEGDPQEEPADELTRDQVFRALRARFDADEAVLEEMLEQNGRDLRALMAFLD